MVGLRHAVRLGLHDEAIVRGPFSVSDGPTTAGRDRCAHQGMRGEISGPTVLLTGTYQVRGSVSQRVLAALPPIALLPAAAADCPTLDLIVDEIQQDKPGRQAMLDRLLDLRLVATLREWFDRADSGAPAWYRAHQDPHVGRALRLVHENPAQPWTVAKLAAEAGLARATFAERFRELVGQPPMTYLAEWRIAQAADRLARTDATVDAIAHQVGYSNAYALSVAFKRTLGIRPTEHRAATRDAPAVQTR
ncbi:AraC-type DNA-binding protein [Saccharopolyspora antimicrobica]|uniref:AraC-like DNA-binding protein n=1 Tax=Saccharopolyspora antimicrobica TaxID=455193 RepID=A0A1I4QEK2_9PSEU|nr:AraC family transcriptional regulator [Saccharopolyspora antimicrobica]RKT84900.1 AraC-like DNA-binding protein [Saccharopolyspora antimicrobica]SFM38457.1 AraC-type DNA-binding protein [Saccharopolyspora antimicrobica]